MFGDQPVLPVVFERQWMFLPVINPGQSAQAVIAVSHLNPVGQGFQQQAPGGIARVSGDQRRAVITEFGFFQQMPVAVIGVGGAPSVEPGFLSDQSGGRVVQSVLFPGLVLDFCQQQLRMVVAILHPGAVGIDLARDQVQVVVILVTGDAPEFVTLGSDLAVSAVAVGAGGAGGQRRLKQSANGVPLLAGHRAVFVARGNPSSQRIVGKTPHAAIGQGFFGQLAEVVPDPLMPTGVRVTDRQQLPTGVVVVIGDQPVGIDRLGDIPLGVAPKCPDRLAAGTAVQETVAILVGRWLVFRRKQRDQPSDFVVAVFGDRPQRILLGDQPSGIVIGLEVLTAIGLDLAHQPRPIVVDVGFFAAVDVVHRHTAVVGPDVTAVHLRERRPVPHATCGFAGALPLPEETRATRQLPLQDDVLIVVVVMLAVTGGIGRFKQALTGVVAVADEGLFGVPVAFAPNLIIDADQMRPLVTQPQRPTRTIVQANNALLMITSNPQAIAIGITDRRQPPGTKVIKPRRAPRQREDQFLRFIPKKNRRARQAVVNRQPLDTGHGKPRAAVLVVDPDHRIAIEDQPMGQ
ncbi:hypothetical protein A9HBioS_4996 [Pseudomonas koreensis]|uniref:Uncharacterized protein n=1 Tax=Pseudomonas koreensis TaxID=198620 RepID=A0AA94JFN1_9PSED|nr:hypothetical protein A9HBioS_4996 [Pseudomonas koreensis]